MKIIKPLNLLLKNVAIKRVFGSIDRAISVIINDSTDSATNSLFVAIRGTKADGHLYIRKAIDGGSSVIVCEELPKELVDNITYLLVENTSIALAQIAAAFYDFPSSKLKLVAVTGTSGKTTTVHLLYHIFKKFGYKVGMLSTINNKIDDDIIPTDLTTPDVITINKLLSMMVEAGCEYCFMEASSHAIDQNRVFALDFVGVAFLNISHDHLDYHETFTKYIDAKKKIFDCLAPRSFALVNADDKHGSIMIQNSKANKYTFALKSPADFNARIISNTMEGLELCIDHNNVWMPLVGEFSAYNILAAYGVACLLGKDGREVLINLSTLSPVPGRFQCLYSRIGFTVVVDYAHKPDALSKLLSAIHKTKSDTSKIILVIGCGGNRDATKRPIMGDIAYKNSDITILTSDNPRYESPESIIEQIKAGIVEVNQKKVISIVNREEAIKAACAFAASGDIVVVAGKGHEDYQIINGAKLPFDDVEVVKSCL